MLAAVLAAVLATVLDGLEIAGGLDGGLGRRIREHEQLRLLLGEPPFGPQLLPDELEDGHITGPGPPSGSCVEQGGFRTHIPRLKVRGQRLHRCHRHLRAVLGKESESWSARAGHEGGDSGVCLR